MLLFPLLVSFAAIVPWVTAESQVLLNSINTGKVIDAEFKAYVQDLLEENSVTGISLAIVHANGQAEFGTWGNKTEDGIAMTSDTLFNLASCSKAFAAAAVGILIDDFANGRNSTPLPPGVKEFTWKTKVKDLLPEDWELMDAWASEKVNIQDILSHVSGLPRHDLSYGPSDSPLDIVQRMKHLQPDHELCEKWSYNNQMYVVAAHIVSTYAGSYIDFVKERILGPLGMKSTTFSPREAARSGKLTQSWVHEGRRIPYWFTEDVIELQAGPGALISSTEDMAKWVAAWLNSGSDPLTGSTIIPRSAYEAITSAYAITDGQGRTPDLSISAYGMGWWRTSYRGHEFLHHTGAIPGFSTRVTFLPSAGFGIVALTNTDEKASVNSAISFRIIDDILGLPHVVSSAGSSVDTVPCISHASGIVANLENLTGTYTNAGYGSFTLCSSESTSSYCEGVLQDFAAIDAYSPRLPPLHSGSQLLAAWPRLWSTHLRFVHLGDNRFTLISPILFPYGYGEDVTPFETYEHGTEAEVRFVLEGERAVGFELIGGDPSSYEQSTSAWFSRV